MRAREKTVIGRRPAFVLVEFADSGERLESRGVLLGREQSDRLAKLLEIGDRAAGSVAVFLDLFGGFFER